MINKFILPFTQDTCVKRSLLGFANAYSKTFGCGSVSHRLLVSNSELRPCFQLKSYLLPRLVITTDISQRFGYCTSVEQEGRADKAMHVDGIPTTQQDSSVTSPAHNLVEPSTQPEASGVLEQNSSLLPDKLYKTIELELLSYETAVLDSYSWFILTAASHLGIEVGKVWAPRKSDKFRFPLLKSAHVHKKHRVHYEIRTHHKFITLNKLTGSTASTYLEYIQRNLPEGIGMKVSKLEVLPKPDYIVGDPS